MGGSLTDDELSPFATDESRLDVFFETGTYKGVSTRTAAKYFKDVYTFEINGPLFIESQNESLKHGLLNAHHYFGNSYSLMSLIMQTDKRKAFFFLDAHQSGSDSSNNGQELVPLMQELEMINRLYPKQYGVVCVDDYRLWTTEPIPEDWKHITNEKIVKCLSDHEISKTFACNDRFYIVINE
jgi:hypothetical protein